MKTLNYIAGEWHNSGSGVFFPNINPADVREVVSEVAASDARDVAKAVEACQSAQGEWENLPAPLRGDLLRKAGDIFSRRKEELAVIMTREMGKTLEETRGDIQEAIDTAYYAAVETRRLFGFNAPSEMRNKMNLSFRVPVGICGIITAWNFPIAVPSWKILPALACGNTVIFKPSEEAPHSGSVFAEILEEAGIPKGVFNVVHGRGDVGKAIVEHPAISLIGFTGSTSTGKWIAGRCGTDNKRCSLEMGGKNALVVLPDANMDLALEGVLWGAFGTTGQRCTATSRLILHRDIHDIFVDRLTAASAKLVLGNGLEEGVQVGPIISEVQMNKIEQYVEHANKESRCIQGGKRLTDGGKQHGYFFPPTIFVGVESSHKLFREEVFGPVLAVTKADSFEHAIALVNDSDYGLSSAVYTQDVNVAFRAIRDIRAGITYINAPTIGAEAHMPFGGIKDTGNGHREGGWTAFDIFTEWKTVYVDYSGMLQRAQIDNRAD